MSYEGDRSLYASRRRRLVMLSSTANIRAHAETSVAAQSVW